MPPISPCTGPQPQPHIATSSSLNLKQRAVKWMGKEEAEVMEEGSAQGHAGLLPVC